MRVLTVPSACRFGWRCGPGRRLTRDFFRYAGPVVTNEVLWGAGTALYPAFFGHMDAAIVAAYSIGTNVQKLFNVLTKALATPAVSSSAPRSAPGSTGGCAATSRAILACSVLASLLAGGLLALLAPGLLSLFHIDAATRTVARVLLGMLILRLPLESFNYAAIIGLMRAGGDTRTAMVIDLTTLWVVGVGGTFAPAWCPGRRPGCCFCRCCWTRGSRRWPPSSASAGATGCWISRDSDCYLLYSVEKFLFGRKKAFSPRGCSGEKAFFPY